MTRHPAAGHIKRAPRIMPLLTAALGLGLAAFPQGSHASSPAGRVDDASLIRLSRMMARGQREITVSVLATPGTRASALAARVHGSLLYADEPTGLFILRMPIEQLARLEHAPEIDALTIDGDPSIVPPNGLSGPGFMEEYWFLDSPPPSTTPPASLNSAPHLRHQMGVDRLPAGLPADGRGITIAHVENFPDFLSPELAQARDAQGKPAPKFRDVINVPEIFPRGVVRPSLSDWNWVEITPGWGEASHRRLRAAGPPRKPADVVRFGTGVLLFPKALWDQLKLGNAAVEGNAVPVPVLIDLDRRTVRLDLSQSWSFDGVQPVGAYARTQAFGVLAADAGAKEGLRMGYAVQFENEARVSLAFGKSLHNTMTTGIMAGSLGEHGQVEGVAPAAQVISVNCGISPSAYARALILAARDPRVDLIMAETYESSNGRLAPLDGSSMLARLADRLAVQTGKLILVTAANDYNIQSVEDLASGPHVLGVGAVQTDEDIRSFDEGVPDRPADVANASSAGPSGDGRPKPDFLAPNLAVAPSPRFESLHLPGPPLPTGYNACGGTSCATPIAAGAIADLMSLLRAQGRLVSAAQLRSALRLSADPIDGVAAYDQGHGRLDIAAAYAFLGRQPRVSSVQVSGRVENHRGEDLTRFGEGQGLFLREGQSASMPSRHTLTFSGLGEGVSSVEVRPVISTPAFTFPARIPVAKGRATLGFGVAQHQTGADSALVQLRQGDKIVGATMATVISGDQLAVGRPIRWTPTVSRRGPKLFIQVPAGLAGLQITATASDHNLFVNARPASARWAQGPLLVKAGRRLGTTVFQPESGVWEVAVQYWLNPLPPRADTDGEDAAAAPLSIEIRALPVATDAAAPGEAIESLTGAVTRFVGAVSPLAPKLIDFDVGKNAKWVVVGALGGSPSLGVLLYRCEENSCDPVRYSLLQQAFRQHPLLTIFAPKPGHWRAVVIADRPVETHASAFVGYEAANADSTATTRLSIGHNPATTALHIVPGGVQATEPVVSRIEAADPALHLPPSR